MNAYKLAEELQGFGYLENDLHFCPFQAQVDMLIHQADYIAQLEKGLESSIALNKAQADQIETMKNPIMQAISQAFDPVKELTDEEINKLYMEHGNKEWDWQIDFARAILRKAQEK